MPIYDKNSVSVNENNAIVIAVFDKPCKQDQQD